MSTIFDSVVTKENDHTSLLRNIMQRDSKAASAILSHLLKRDVSEKEAALFEFKTQHSFVGANGREIPDILVQGPSLCCLIEAKIDPALDLTPAQKEGYRACFTADGERHLVFLVPEDWQYKKSATRVQAEVGDDVLVTTKTWQDLVAELEEFSKPLADEIFSEAIRFWKWRFEDKAMTPEEKQSLSPWLGERYSAIRKLERTISRAKKLFDARGFDTEIETSDVDSYDFYIKRGGSYLLWVGIWKKSSTPLSYGFDTKEKRAGEWSRPSNPPPAPLTAGSYELWPLEPNTWDDAEEIYATVRSFLKSHPTA
jgi:hypothetical protein